MSAEIVYLTSKINWMGDGRLSRRDLRPCDRAFDPRSSSLAGRAIAALEVIAHPSYAVMMLCLVIAAVTWDLMEGSLLRLDSGWFDVLVVVYAALSTAVFMSGMSWVLHRSMHSFGDPHRTFSMTSAHAPHHDADPAVQDSWRTEVLEAVATSYAGGAVSAVLAVVLATYGKRVPMPLAMVAHPAVSIAYLVAYVTLHYVNYHFGTTPVHVRHHEDTRTNLSPNPVDVLCGTTDVLEDGLHMVPNVVFGAGAAVGILTACSRIAARTRMPWG